MLILRQSTAKAISLGPFVDKGDGVTLEVGLVSALDHASTGILLSKNGGALTIRHASVTASTYDAYGNYIVTLDTTDTNTCGTLRMQFSEAATCLPVFQDFMVVEEEVFDDLYAASAVGYLKPTTAGRDLDVSAGGEAGVDWANVGSPTTAVNLSGTNIKTDQVVASVSGAVGSVTGLTASNLDATVSSRLATAGYTAPPSAATIATAVLTTGMTESYAADGVAPTLAQAQFMKMQSLQEFDIVGTTRTVYALDGTTVVATFTLNSATAPTATTRAS